MPNLNLKGTTAPVPGMRPGIKPAGDANKGGVPPALLYGLGAIVVLAALAFVLNAAGVVHLWGKKPARVVATPPPAAATAPVTTPPDTAGLVEFREPSAPAKTPARPSWSPTASSTVPKIPMTSGGKYSVQVSSWTTEQKARIQADVLTKAGFPAFVEKADVTGGGKHFRVYIGRYSSPLAAKTSAEKFSPMLESGYWVVRLEN
ncbi:MAG: SPOR domain-containing protein [Bacteroidota bacterium]|nr:SPOR domain-containing protein [Bacteroidota bacterium]